ncbi:dihydrofolate reductase family protein [Kribbella sp. WER1]
MTQRPRVVVSVGASVDGKVALARDALLMRRPSSELWSALRPPAAEKVDILEMVRTRFGCSAILEGSGSLIPEDETPGELPAYDGDVAELYEHFLPPEITAQVSPPHMWFTTVDSRGRVRWTEKHENWDVLVLVSRSTPADYLAYLRRERICYLVTGDERVDLPAAIEAMGTELGITYLLSTAGGGLNGALLRADLIDELYLTVYPALVGGLGTPSVTDGPPLPIGQPATQLKLLSTHTDTAGTVHLHYAVPRG